jgi:hypothetical protein
VAASLMPHFSTNTWSFDTAIDDQLTPADSFCKISALLNWSPCERLVAGLGNMRVGSLNTLVNIAHVAPNKCRKKRHLRGTILTLSDLELPKSNATSSSRIRN